MLRKIKGLLGKAMLYPTFVTATVLIVSSVVFTGQFAQAQVAPGTVTSLSYENPTTNSVTLVAKYTQTAVVMKGYFEYLDKSNGGNPLYTSTTTMDGNTASLEFRKEITTGLISGHTYYFHFVTVTANGNVNYPTSTLTDPTFTVLSSSPTNTGTGNNTGTNNGSGSNTGTNNGSGSNTTSSLTNPLSGVNTIPDFIAKLLNIMLKIAVPILVCMFIWTGFLFVKAQGKEEQLTHAKNALLWTVVGAALVLGAWTLASAISGTINQLK